MDTGENLLPSHDLRRKKVKIWSTGNSLSASNFVFGILLCIVVYEFCQLLLPALKMTPERVETC